MPTVNRRANQLLQCRAPRVALAPAELVGVAQPGRARRREELPLEAQARFLKRQLALPVSPTQISHQTEHAPSKRAFSPPLTFMIKQLNNQLAGRPLRPFTYRDFGSLVSSGRSSTVRSLMGFLVGGSSFVEGYFARLTYRFLYKIHEAALYGGGRALLGLFGQGAALRGARLRLPAFWRSWPASKPLSSNTGVSA